MSYSLQENILIVKAYIFSGSFMETREIFADTFPNANIPANRRIQNLSKRS